MFQWIKFRGGVSFEGMMQNFNCGIGMVLICKKYAAEDVLYEIESNGGHAVVIGNLEKRDGLISKIFVLSKFSVQLTSLDKERIKYICRKEPFWMQFGSVKLLKVAVMISGTGSVGLEFLLPSFSSFHLLELVKLFTVFFLSIQAVFIASLLLNGINVCN